jgi:hypothetical protein
LISKIETSSKKHNEKSSSVKVLDQAESGLNESYGEKIEITPKTTGSRLNEEFKTATKKLTSKTATKIVEGLDLSTPTQAMKKLALKKSQSVALPLGNNEDTPMKDERQVP